MVTTLNFFPMLDEELYDRLDIDIETPVFLFSKANKLMPLNISNDDFESTNIYEIYDANNTWTNQEYNFLISQNIVIKNVALLFEKNGIANSNSVIGIAATWKSKSSLQRGIIEIGELVAPNTNISIRMDHSFEECSIYGEIEIEIFLYLKSRNDKFNDGYASKPGTILGTLEKYLIIIDGNGSVFPIVEVSDKSKPLWYVHFDWEDPLIDAFSDENLAICINRSHQSYELLEIQNNLKGSPFFYEVLASALHLIMMKIIESNYWEEIRNNQNVASGSIAEAIIYFIETFEWDISSSEELAYSIRLDFDRRMGGLA